MNTDPLKSAQPCGCDEGAGWTCQWHKAEEERMEDHGKQIDGTFDRPVYVSPEEKVAQQKARAEAVRRFEEIAKNADATREAGYVTKDSGERKQFASGMQRDTTTGKWKFHLVRFGPMFMRWVGLLTRGAVKYDDNNWMKANGAEELKRFMESADRHYAVWATYRLTGVNIEDPEHPTREPLTEDHAAAVFFNINGAEYVVERMAQ